MKTIHHGLSCPNTNCSAYGDHPEDPSQETVIRYGHSKTGRQRYRCTRCGHTFTETVGTIFYRRHTPDDEIVLALSQIAEGSRLSSVARTTGHKIDTISAWVKSAGQHAADLEQWLLDDYQIEQAQLDGLWSFVGHKGEKNRL
jgi:insertion element IS1 protein InsB